MRLVHRDISPPNVLISFVGEVKLTDFGIAKVARQSKQTQAGVLKGKFAYLSPEQSMGEPIDRRSDIYALGLVLFEATVGMRANPGAVEVEQIYAASQARVLQPSLHDPSYPADLERIYLKATAKAPRDRYQTAREMHRDLADFQARRGLLVSSPQLGSFLQRLFPEDAAAEHGGPPDSDTLPPTSTERHDTAPERLMMQGTGFEDDEATVLEQTLPPDELQTLDSSGGLMVIQPDGPNIGQLQPIDYDEDFDEESTHVALSRPSMGELGGDPINTSNQNVLHRSDLFSPAGEPAFDPFETRPREPRLTGPRLPVVDPASMPTEPQSGLPVVVQESYRGARPNPVAFSPSTPAPQVTPPLHSPPPAPRQRLESSSVPLGRIAQPLAAPPSPTPRPRSGRAWLWLMIGLLLVLAIAAVTTYLVIEWEKPPAPALDPAHRLEEESRGPKTTPLEVKKRP
jgi:serine/threonine protein kinase